MKYLIDWLELKTTKMGKQYYKASLKAENGSITNDVSIWSDHPDFGTLRAGGTIFGEIKTNEKGYKTLYAGTFSSPKGRAPSGAVSAAKITSESVEKAQARKNDSIAYFNSLNSAIAIVLSEKYGSVSDKALMQDEIVFWREWFLAEYRNYEAGDVTDKKRPF